MFDIDELISDCQTAVRDGEPRLAVRDVLERVLAEPTHVASTFAPTEGGLSLLHCTDELTVLHVVWAPGMQLFPHDHRMWAVIGIYNGQEDNTFYRRGAPSDPALTESGGRSLVTSDVLVLGDDTIHAVANPRQELTGAIHVYGGDFVEQPRSQWGPGPLEERPYDFEVVNRQFADANAAWRDRTSGRS